ncbi:MAG: tRNA (N6-isopentenyl adenosine(37)-C2)-methylthiotransferase MiaB, partial [Bacteroidota bacterium]
MDFDAKKEIDETRQGEVLMTANDAGKKKLFLESYGCQMNFSDSEIVASILADCGYSTTRSMDEANL